jgi:acyl-CoA synthetase (AMP-forming)/AMP-acid ligase II
MASSGQVVTYRQLDERSNRLANLLYDRGLRPGDSVAICSDNNERFFEFVWAAQRSGLFYTPVNSRLTPTEIEYIVDDCGARALIVSASRRDVAQHYRTVESPIAIRLLLGSEAVEGWEPYEEATRCYPTSPLDNEVEGVDMLYSSGTTGRPKGVRRPARDVPAGTPDNAVFLMREVFACDASTVFLSTAPLYHGAPLILSMAVQRLGGAVVVMERFDPQHALELIERHGVTHSQWVPTMFVRLLKLAQPERDKWNLGTHRVAIHGAGPCPIEVKDEMIRWWGPILVDYYSGTEGIGTTSITSDEWLTHKGSVGRAVIGELHIIDDEGRECDAGQVGSVYFSGGPAFEYHGDPAKTTEATNDRGWVTLGDVGYLDEDGYLYLTDRKAFMIISGGVNIYPQEVEDALILHPKVADVAVFGVPNEDLGEETKAVVQAADGVQIGQALAAELDRFCRSRLASYKCPRSYDFVEALPRAATGKLYKRELRDPYWAKAVP